MMKSGLYKHFSSFFYVIKTHFLSFHFIKSMAEERRWYSLRVVSQKEHKIADRLRLEVERSGWKDIVTAVIVPSEKVYKIKNGKKVISERNILPGYLLIEAVPSVFTAEIVKALTDVQDVMHFLPRIKPDPLSTAEVNRLLGKVDESSEVGETMIEPYLAGETIKIIDGPFSGFVGDIQEVNDEKKKLKVIVKIFGRGTEVELNFLQVEKDQ